MITRVAIRIPDPDNKGDFITLNLPAPNRHHHIISEYHFCTGQSLPEENEQGFLDEEGNFYNRKDALAHALANNQVKDVNNIRCNMLFSEDVW